MAQDYSKLNSVFSLDEAAQALGPRKSKRAVVEYLKYYLETHRLRRVTREIYAVVPPGLNPARFSPDVFLVAAAVRRDVLIAHHGALELLGVAHSIWRAYAVWTRTRRTRLDLDNASIRFIVDPHPAWTRNDRLLGTRMIERQGRLMRVTGPERTLVEGFRRPAHVGGLEELIRSAGAFTVLDLMLLESVLAVYGTRRLWAAVGWFLEAHQQTFHVPDEFLDLCAHRKPRRPQYLVRDLRGGALDQRWNLIVPADIV